MLVTELGMVTDVSPVQNWKARSPMLVTELGMVTDVSPVQYWYLQFVVCQRLLVKTVEK